MRRLAAALAIAGLLLPAASLAGADAADGRSASFVAAAADPAETFAPAVGRALLGAGAAVVVIGIGLALAGARVQRRCRDRLDAADRHLAEGGHA